jgi:NADPH:quinone reductase-like Zn-dependent oxidoreductase
MSYATLVLIGFSHERAMPGVTEKGEAAMATTKSPLMKAIRFHEYGGLAVLKYEEVPRPEPQAGEVLIQVRAASVNPFDLAVREGWVASLIPLQLPAIAGVDVAGIVRATGEGVTEFRLGQQVYGFLNRYSGAYAEYAVAAVETIAPHPQTLDSVQAASVPLAATAAWQALFDVGGLKEGQTVLIHGGAGGVGTFAVQLAKRKGAQVLATASTQHLEYVYSLGADQVIDYNTTPFETVAHAVDVVLDLIAGGILVSLLAPPSEEEAATYGVRTGFLGAQPSTGLLQELASLLDSGQIKPHVDKVFPLEHAQQAQQLKRDGHIQGKIVLKIAD